MYQKVLCENDLKVFINVSKNMNLMVQLAPVHFPKYAVLTYKLLDRFKQSRHITISPNYSNILCKQLSKNWKVVQLHSSLIIHFIWAM